MLLLELYMIILRNWSGNSHQKKKNWRGNVVDVDDEEDVIVVFTKLIATAKTNRKATTGNYVWFHLQTFAILSKTLDYRL